MENVTGIQLRERRERLEEAASLLLGRMVFEFARLDMAVGLCAVWVDDGKRLHALTPHVEEMSFHAKLQFVKKAVESSIPKGSDAYLGYMAWLDRAHLARVHRNELFHGRWGIDAVTEHVERVLGLPTSANQRVRRYTLAELEGVLAELRSLQTDLDKLRRQRPL